MLKIHLIRTYYPHWCQYSGIHQFVKYLDTQQYQVDIWRASDNHDDFPLKNLAIRYGLHTLVQMQGMKWYKLSDLMAEWKAFQKFRTHSVDIIHYLDGEHTAQFLPLLFKLPKRKRPKMIATYHQPPELLDSLLAKEVIPHLDAITVVSPQQVSYFSQLTEPHKIHSILHGIDINYFKPDNSLKENGKFKCLTVGRYLRDFEVLRQVAEKLENYENIEFHVVSSVATEVENLANVTVYRDIDDASLLTLYQQSNTLFLPLINSTANNALLEGIACGLPVITTRLPSVQDYLSDQAAFFIPKNDPEQFVEAILNLANHSQLCQTMGESARNRAKELDWQLIVSQYEKVYSKVVETDGD
ncbi:glycosyl transferase group 1 [Gloeothece citriformis PCC 7424]|uniref:Glycosyl transferase group 1 n=1 Tax=Gloeothece citriformis (strain PCC 7424) TaxID=65393 RepID=B7K6R9_GLOC7|nr:glycosyltransferase family 4 protein [Gloeothece citriformis]ACK72618.1 glycosyl transferase group 1 [Gloeothece citriformis PCC 7424]